jgi:hypothetical protein
VTGGKQPACNSPKAKPVAAPNVFGIAWPDDFDGTNARRNL